MTAYDIIPDIHGQADLLTKLLSSLGYLPSGGAFRHPEAGRRALFLGDFIDRGPRQAETLDIVQRMTGEGCALAIMGNHELNALQYHATDPDTGAPLRPRSAMNARQHAAFLAEFPLGAATTRDALAWMAQLPLFLEIDGLRAVHACWHGSAIDHIRRSLAGQGLVEDLLVRSRRDGDPLRDAIDKALKGPETRLPQGEEMIDDEGRKRAETRIAWWTRGADAWGDVVASWPPAHPIPQSPLTAEAQAAIRDAAYPAGAAPVFFGHYWLEGTPWLQAANALCLDYSAGAGGPLVAYRFDPEEERGKASLDLANLTICPPR